MSDTMLLERPSRDIVDIHPDRGSLETLADRYYALLVLNPEDLARELTAIAREEDRAPEGERHAAARRRLAAWLLLHDEDARIIAGAYDDAVAALPESTRARRLEAERDAVLNGMGFADFRRLTFVLPWLRSESGVELLFPEGVPPRRSDAA